MQSNMGYSWICDLCLLATLPVDLSFSSDFSESDVAEQINSGPDNDELVCLRRQNGKELLMAHLNINRVQNKFEELTNIIRAIRPHIMFVSETKIDYSYPNAQFSIPGYSLYRNDRKKGGGGILALISTALSKTRLKLNRDYKTLEVIAFDVKTETGNMVIIGVYRPPRAVCGEYQLLLEKELSEICNWASLKSIHAVVIGDLNLDRMRPDKSEGKLLLDLEVEQGFDCLITKPTRTEKHGKIITESLIDVLLSNRPELFQYSGNYHPCLSDHALIYGALKQKINLNKPKIINFRSFKNFDSQLF